MATRLKPIGHEDRLSLVEHLDELRTRIIICVVAFIVVFGICLWQDDRILDIVNRPLAEGANKKPCDETRDPLEQADCWQQAQKLVDEQIAAAARSPPLRRATTRCCASRPQELARAAEAAAAASPRGSPKRPVTLGVGEPLTATLRRRATPRCCSSLPLLLYQLYAFVLPAFSPRSARSRSR